MKRSVKSVILWAALFCVVWCTTAAKDRQAIADSLIDAVRIADTDSLKAKLLCIACGNYYFFNTDSALYYCEQGLDLAEKAGNRNQMAYCYHLMGNAYYMVAKYEKALYNYQQALTIRSELGDRQKESSTLGNIGLVYSNLHDYGKAHEYLVQVANIKAEIDSFSSAYCLSLIHLARNYFYMADYPQALKYGLKALGISTNQSDSIGIANALDLVAGIYAKQGNFNSSLEYYHRAIRINRAVDRKALEAGSLVQMGVVYEHMGNYRQAIDHYIQALAIERNRGDSNAIATIYNNIGVIYDNHWQDNENALKFYRKALTIYEQNHNKRETSINLNNIGRLLGTMGAHREALKYAHQGLEMAIEIRSRDGIMLAYQGLAGIYAGAGEFKKAYQYEQSFGKLRDSLLNEKNSRQLIEMETRYNMEKKVKENELLQKENNIKDAQLKQNRTTQYTLSGGLILILLLLGVLYNRYRLKKRSNKLISREKAIVEGQKNQLSSLNKELKLQKENMELKALQAQMNPHFIFNSLNSIQRFITTHKTEKAHEYLSMFGKIIRNTLNNSDKEAIPVVEELNNLEIYIALEKARVENVIDYQTDIDPKLDIHNLKIPPMLIQPYVENAIWHGLMPKGADGVIQLTMKWEEDRILCTIEDNGIGREQARKIKAQSKMKTQPSKGMKITEERLNALWAKKDQQFQVKVIDLKNKQGEARGTSVLLNLPIDF